MIVYILLDAFRGDYISKKNTPFLFNLTKNSNNVFYKYVKPSLTFCERTEIFSGKEPLESLFFTAYKRDASQSDLKKYRKILNLLHLIEVFLKLNGKNKIIFRKKIQKIFIGLGVKAKINNIPLNEIWKFSLSEDYYDIRHAPFDKNIFNLLSEKNLKVLYKTFTSLSGEFLLGDDEKINYVKQFYSEFDFVFLYVGDTDALGHKFGPSSHEFLKYLKKIDNKLKDLIETLQKDKDITFIINGDHGMSDVSFTCDVKKYIYDICKKNKLDSSSIDLFLDSTLLRVYTPVIEIQKILLNDSLLNSLGTFVYKRANFKFKKYYGDLIWCINSGGLIFPNYFQFSIIKGMHGYIPRKKEHYGSLIIKSPKSLHPKLNKIKLAQVNNILWKEINARY